MRSKTRETREHLNNAKSTGNVMKVSYIDLLRSSDLSTVHSLKHSTIYSMVKWVTLLVIPGMCLWFPFHDPSHKYILDLSPRTCDNGDSLEYFSSMCLCLETPRIIILCKFDLFYPALLTVSAGSVRDGVLHSLRIYRRCKSWLEMSVYLSNYAEASGHTPGHATVISTATSNLKSLQ